MAMQIFSDLRHAGRTLWKSPVFAVASLSILSIGIAVNTAAYSAVSTLIKKPLPFRDSERLVLLREHNPEKGLKAGASYAAFADWARQSTLLEDVGAVEAVAFSLDSLSEPLSVPGGRVSGAFFRTLGLQPLRGRTFAPDEERSGGNRVVMIGQRMWERRFRADPAIVGRTLTVDGEEAVIVGVVPRITRGYFTGYDVWAPLVPSAGRETRSLQVVARLKAGVPVDRVRAEMDTIASGLAQQYPESNQGWSVEVYPMDQMMRHVVPGYTIVLVVVFLLLLIVCTNIANLQLARASARRREIAVRLALGASRFRVVWQLLSEGVLLAGLGGAFAFLLVVWIRGVLVASVPELSEIVIGPQAALFTTVVSLVTGVVFGLTPALSVSNPDLNDVLKTGGRGQMVAGRKVRSALVVFELSIAVMLLVGLGLLVRSFLGLHSVDAGIRADKLLALHLRLPQPKYADPERRAAFYGQAVERLAALAGVESAGAATGLPLTDGAGSAAFEVEGRRDTLTARQNVATPGYFRTVGIARRRGRLFSENERDVVILNERAAHALWPQENAVGKRIRIPGQAWSTVIGVVADARQVLTQPVAPEIYTPYRVAAQVSMNVVVRTKGDPRAFAEVARTELRALDASLPAPRIQTMDDVISGYLPSAIVAGAGVFSGAALLLAAVGLYGIVSYLMSQRTHEIGIRMALGAASTDVIRLVLRQGARMAGLGTAIGILASFGFARLLSGLLFGVSPYDPVVFTGVPVVLTCVAFAACYLPARRATKVSPASALRNE